jgi:hypothetical protein
MENEGIEGNVQAMESNEGEYLMMVENKETQVCTEGQHKP